MSDWYTALAARLPGISLPPRTRPDEGHYVRGEPGSIEYVWTERGQETVQALGTVDELAWALVRDTTFWQAVAWEKARRRRGEDVRRQIFARQAELCEPYGFGERARVEQAKTLATHPYDDQLARRADRWGELMAAGMSREDAVAQATREFP